MNATRYLRLSLLFVLLCALIVGCVPASAPTTSAGEGTASEASAPAAGEAASAPAGQVEIRAAWWGDTNRHELYNQIIDAFEAANPDVRVVREPTSWADYWDKMSVQSASGSLPDFLGMHPQYSNDYINRGVLLPLDELVAAETIDLSEFSQSAIDTGVVAGVNYMVPMGITFQSVFANKALFDELGVEVPSFDWTYDDLRETGLQVREALDAAGQSDAWMVADNSTNYQFFRYFIRQRGKELFTESGDVGYAAEDAAAYWSTWKELADLGIATDAATTVEFATATLEDNLLARKMILLSSIPVNQLTLYVNTLPDLDIVLLRNPSQAGFEPGEFPEGAHFAISATAPAEKQAAAARLLNFWVNDPASLELFKLDQGVPGNQVAAETIVPLLNETQVRILEYVNTVAEIATASTYAPAGASEVEALFRSLGEQVMYGTSTPEEAADALVTGAQEIVEQAR